MSYVSPVLSDMPRGTAGGSPVISRTMTTHDDGPKMRQEPAIGMSSHTHSRARIEARWTWLFTDIIKRCEVQIIEQSPVAQTEPLDDD